ncbi:unnamed protein product, partial [Aphanomyces euteiches]
CVAFSAAISVWMSKPAKRAVKSKTAQATAINQGSEKKTATVLSLPLDQPDDARNASSLSKAKTSALWCDTSVELLLRLRFREMNERFTSAKISQMKKDAYTMLAA